MSTSTAGTSIQDDSQERLGSGSSALSPNSTSTLSRRKSTGISDVSHFTQARHSTLIGAQWSLLSSTNDDAQSGERPISPLYKARHSVDLPTGSRYDGTWDSVSMNGQGVFTMPHGVKFEGDMHDGCLKDTGVLSYSGGSHVTATYTNEPNANMNASMYRMATMAYTFHDELQFGQEGWEYCSGSDRRFHVEKEEGLQPVCKERLTPRHPPPPLPPGCFDTGDGVFDPRTCCVTAHDTGEIIRMPAPEERDWITKNCRTTKRVGVGYRPEFYENWAEEEAAEAEAKAETERQLASESAEQRLYEDADGNVEDDDPDAVGATPSEESVVTLRFTTYQRE